MYVFLTTVFKAGKIVATKACLLASGEGDEVEICL